MRSSRRLIAAVVALSLVTAACGSDETADDTAPTDTADTVESDVEDPPAEDVAETDATTDDEAEDADEADAEDEAEEAPAATEEEEFVAPGRGDADLVIWADETRTEILAPIAEQFSAEEGVVVEVFEVPFGEIRDNLSIQGPAGEGPDVVIGAHDWLGELVANGAIASIDIGADADLYEQVALDAFTYEGQLYGLPYATENVALYRNADLVPDAPASFEELEDIALGLVADGTVEVPLGIPEGPADPYHNYPLFSAAGGYVFGQTEDGTYDASDVGIDSEGGLAAAEKFGAWAESGLVSSDVTYDVMIQAFQTGNAPFAITGPWAAGDFADVNYVVEPIPPVDGGTPAPFVGVQGFMISSFSEAPDLATTFVLDYLNTEELQLELFEAGARPPAMTSALEKVSDDPDIVGFAAAAADGQPLPNIPAMSAVWESWTDAYSLVFSGEDPVETFIAAGESIRSAIAES